MTSRVRGRGSALKVKVRKEQAEKEASRYSTFRGSGWTVKGRKGLPGGIRWDVERSEGVVV